jgi:response regulator of citrate/malate metabolism
VSNDAALRVLIVEDDPMTAQAHADFVARVPGFEVVGTCLGGHEAIERFDELAAAGTSVDIVLLDMNLTDSHGLEVAGRLNSRGQDVDIIAITAVRHLQVIRSAISSGITQYLIKPFTFASFREKLENQREFRRGLSGSGTLATQASVDNALSALRSVSSTTLPKGLIAETLDAVSAFVRDSAVPVSATEVGRRLELSQGDRPPVLSSISSRRSRRSSSPDTGHRGGRSTSIGGCEGTDSGQRLGPSGRSS